MELLGKELELGLRGGEVIDHEGRHRRAEFLPRSASTYSLILDGRVIDLSIRGEGGRYRIGFAGWDYDVRVEPSHLRELRRLFKRDALSREGAGEEVVARMPGLVVEVKVEEGQEVEEGQGLIIIEAMKMENEVRAPCTGVVERVGVR
ncbi:MAG: biotin/lipoyl-containing protein, partial [Candidatus Bipolaricaulia bacterium]